MEIQQTTRKQKIVKPRMHTVRDMYKWYKKNTEKPMVYWMFREVLLRHNRKVADAIIFGDVYNVGNYVGRILIKKIKRNYEKAVPNWGESKKRKAELIAQGIQPKDEQHPDGEEWMVFYTDPWYLRWAWSKRRLCRVKNQTVYKFLPTNNRSKKAGDFSLERLGNKGRLTVANRANPLLHLRYEKVLNED